MGGTLSSIGDALVPVATAFAALEIGDATDLGLVLAAAMGSRAAFFMVGGVWADRLPRRLVMIGADAVRAVAQIVIALAFFTDAIEVWHLIGAGAGYLSLVVFGLTNSPAAIAHGVSGPRVGAAALSLGLTALLMVWFKVPHPPAGATTLIISLGVLTTLPQLGELMLAVLLLVVQGIVINRLAGVEYPWWTGASPT